MLQTREVEEGFTGPRACGAALSMSGSILVEDVCVHTGVAGHISTLLSWKELEVIYNEHEHWQHAPMIHHLLNDSA